MCSLSVPTSSAPRQQTHHPTTHHPTATTHHTKRRTPRTPPPPHCTRTGTGTGRTDPTRECTPSTVPRPRISKHHHDQSRERGREIKRAGEGETYMRPRNQMLRVPF